MAFALLSLGSSFFALAHLSNNLILHAATVASMYIYGPTIWWLIKSQVSGATSLFHQIHAAPMAMVFIISLIFPAENIVEMQLFGTISRLVYTTLAARELWANRAILSERNTALWLSILVFISCWGPAWNLSLFLQHWLEINWLTPAAVSTINTLGTSASTLVLIWWALVNPSIYLNGEVGTNKLNTAATDFDREIYDRLRSLLETDFLYLEPTLTLEKTATAIAVTPRELSSAVNRCTNQSFRAHIRQHRVSHAKALLSKKTSQEASVFEIALQSGFATASSFHDSFKTETGTTPSKYRAAYNLRK